jgi:two-component system nitrate/nitrite sensor histidine kinase NarX
MVMASIRTWWREQEGSLILRLGGAIAAITLLAVLGMAVSAMVAISVQGSGEAINQAGSLRMKSWQLSSLNMAYESHNPHLQARLRGGIRDFEQTLKSAAILNMIGDDQDSPLARSYQAVQQEWTGVMRPRFEEWLPESRTPPSHRTGQVGLLDEVGHFVSLVNDLVKNMEETTEAKIWVMRIVLAVALVLTLVVVVLTIYLIHTRFVMPLRDLLRQASDAGRGNLATRTPYTGPDELGKLGAAFNLMAEDLSKLYGDLEARVEQKTEELTRSNSALDLLYTSITRLHGAQPGEAVYRAVLQEIEQKLGIGPGVLCLGEYGANKGRVIAHSPHAEPCLPCIKASCTWCHGTDKTRFSQSPDFRQHLTLPLADAGQQYGVLIFEIPPKRHMEAWQVQLLEALSRHIGVAIGAERQMENRRRLALLEERAVIARELHDSLAQSLAYMKIQVNRMGKLLQGQAEPGTGISAVRNVLEEMREGLDSAYRQLRELLSSFRIKMEDGTLEQALLRTVNEFSDRGDLQVDLEMNLNVSRLSPNEEIHVLHIVREALSNVLHHAQAKTVRVNLTEGNEGQVVLTVEDDGVGIVRGAATHHYGMTIMEERARTLHGAMNFTSRAGGGTTVRLAFSPGMNLYPTELEAV